MFAAAISSFLRACWIQFASIESALLAPEFFHSRRREETRLGKTLKGFTLTRVPVSLSRQDGEEREGDVGGAGRERGEARWRRRRSASLISVPRGQRAAMFQLFIT